MARTVQLAAEFDAPPERLFDMYLSPRHHSAFTGAPVKIAARHGAPFRAFHGQLTGTILHVVRKRLIVQSWRSVNWPADAVDSTLILTFAVQGDGARIELVHVNVPEEDFAGVSHGWEKFYWVPWKKYLKRIEKQD